MNAFFTMYMLFWGTACLCALGLYLRDRSAFAFSHADYWQFLLRPWKIVTFLIASATLTVMAPYTGDFTWDYYDAAFMSVLTFLSAPWAVGALYKSVRGQLPFKQAFVASCAWLFTASWSYDLYILCRDGHYPATWFHNIFLSSLFYLSAGLLWNLDWTEAKGTTFAFMEMNWPTASRPYVFKRILWYALPFMLIAAALVLPFLWSMIS